MKTSIFYLPGVGTRPQVEQGHAGLNGAFYDDMLREVLGQCQLADRLGYNSVSFTEHHFHSEGFEVSNNPVLLDLYIGLQTKQLRVGQLGIVLPANNPLRVAEDIAMLDRMTGGRANAGFARGYQRRWVDTMAQQTHGVHGVSPHEHDRMDETNRAAFEENFRIIKKAWTEDYISHRGQFWQVPPEGTPWTIEATERFGSGVTDGVITEIAVVPKPVQKPHPPIFQPFASSERTIRFCAQEGITPVLPPLHPLLQRRLVDVYAEASGKEPGEGIGVLRDVIVADTDDEAQKIWLEGPAFCGSTWFAPFGFGRGMNHPDTDEEFDGDRFEEGLALVGTVDTVTRQLETLRDGVPAEWVFSWNYNGLVSDDRIRRSIEAWRSDIVPRVTTWE